MTEAEVMTWLSVDAAAVSTATPLAKSEDATERWVGKHVRRDLTRPLVLATGGKKR